MGFQDLEKEQGECSFTAPGDVLRLEFYEFPAGPFFPVLALLSRFLGVLGVSEESEVLDDYSAVFSGSDREVRVSLLSLYVTTCEIPFLGYTP